jgi:pimeloyl-ACP methyl ester carboxylesterase
VFRSDSRYDELKKLEIPVLIIHGLNDPFIPIEHSKKLAGTIPNARTKWFENMGHDIPPELIDSLINELILNFERNPS